MIPAIKMRNQWRGRGRSKVRWEGMRGRDGLRGHRRVVKAIMPLPSLVESRRRGSILLPFEIGSKTYFDWEMSTATLAFYQAHRPRRPLEVLSPSSSSSPSLPPFSLFFSPVLSQPYLLCRFKSSMERHGGELVHAAGRSVRALIPAW